MKIILGWLRSKLREQPASTTDAQAPDNNIPSENNRSEDYPEDCYNTINKAISKNLTNAFKKRTNPKKGRNDPRI